MTVKTKQRDVDDEFPHEEGCIWLIWGIELRGVAKTKQKSEAHEGKAEKVN